MTIRLQQMHPALVHFPIALLPLAVAADLLGRFTGSKSLHSFGQKSIVLAAAGAAAAAVSGLIAGEEVNVEGDARDMLMTHRNLNVVATIVASCMAVARSRRQTPGAVYLAVGVAGAGLVGYTAYLGGKLVYESGAGVDPAHGVYRPHAPALGAGKAGTFFKAAATDLAQGVKHMATEVGSGKLAPTLVAQYRRRSTKVAMP